MQEELEYKIENVEEKLRGIYPEKDAQRFANAFRIILDIQSNYCNTNTRLKEINKELEILREYLKDKREFTNEIDNFLKRISFGFRGENESLSKEDVEELEHFCKKLTEKMNARFLDVPDVQKLRRIPEAEIKVDKDFYTVELHLSQLQKSILGVESKVWADESILPAILRKGVFIIVGAWEGCELFDRLVAYKISNELEKRGINSLVMTDKYWWEAKNKFGYDKSSVISVGGPISNSLSNGIAERFGMEKYATAIGIKEIEGQLVGYVWGTDARSTLNAGKIFVESHLDEFVRRLG